MMSFKYELGERVEISVSGEVGEVIARAELSNAENQYNLRYQEFYGSATERWWGESALNSVDTSEDSGSDSEATQNTNEESDKPAPTATVDQAVSAPVASATEALLITPEVITATNLATSAIYASQIQSGSIPADAISPAPVNPAPVDSPVVA
jgi:hypothetical protein